MNIKLMPHQITILRDMWDGIERIDPSSEAYKGVIRLLDKLSQQSLKDLEKANIKFISRLASNRIKRASETNTSSMSIVR